MKTTLFLLAAIGAVSASHAAQFRLTVQNTGPQPLSPTFFSASDATFDTFALGGMASTGIKNIAERGNPTALLGIASSAGTSVAASGALAGGPITPGQSRSTVFSTDPVHGYFSFASMLGQTNDGWIGESVSSMGLRLFNGAVPQSFSLVVTGRRAWDAGTEANTQNAADLGFLGGSGNPAEPMGLNHIRVHAGIVSGVGDSWSLLPAWSQDTQLARISVEAVPEPATVVALAAGVVAIVRRRRPTPARQV